jgi:hypothetical protein
VTVNSPVGDGPDGYQQSLSARGVPSTVVDGVIVHDLDVVTGALAGTQVQVEGWARHSRQLDRWGSMADPLDEWLAHLRGVLGGAT